MIIETIVSSMDKEGKVNLAPIGVHLPNNDLKIAMGKEVSLFLYAGSQTYKNLQTLPEGVINFSNDVNIFVETALFSLPFPTLPSHLVRPPRLAEAQSIGEFSVIQTDFSREPARIQGKILHYEQFAGFNGFCRAQWAVLEAAIMATRLQWISLNHIKEAWPWWKKLVEKTGGIKERDAFNRIYDYITQKGIDIQDPDINLS